MKWRIGKLVRTIMNIVRFNVTEWLCARPGRLIVRQFCATKPKARLMPRPIASTSFWYLIDMKNTMDSFHQFRPGFYLHSDDVHSLLNYFATSTCWVLFYTYLFVLSLFLFLSLSLTIETSYTSSCQKSSLIRQISRDD